MKNIKIAHWIFTGLISALLLMSAGMYIAKYDEVAPVFGDLGFPVWLIYPMAVAKFLGVIMLLTKFNKWLTEWAYAGIFFNLMLALGAHLSVGDGDAIPPVVGMALLFGSYFTWRQIQKA
jgi:ABC-type Mn2+/Zn2+ transport system permease subunit